ncbi:MAG: cupin-like domain-containing protein [Pseudomonadota bacterium]
MNTIEIERKCAITPADFARDHLDGIGKPVIVTDAMDQWRAMQEWSFSSLGERFGGDLVPVSLGLMSPVAKMTKLSAFLGHLEQPDGELPGFWVNAGDGRPLANGPAKEDRAAYYLMGWFAFQKHPELLEEIQPPPYFVADWELALSPQMREIFQWVSGRETTSLYVGAEGTLSPLHCDFWNTHAYLAQVRGRKRVMLFPPGDCDFLYGGRVDPALADPGEFPLFANATAYTGTIGPGDMLFMPSGWWHWVLGLENSITVSHNFFNQANFNEHLGGLMRNLPRLVEGFQRHPQWKDAL